jgi:hypothetical protein
MTSRDRAMLMAIAVLAVLGIGWIGFVSPQRQQAAKLASQVASANKQLAEAEGQAADAREAQARYAAAYAAVVSLGKAVPPSREVPALIYQLAQASNQKHVDFSSISTGSSGASNAGSGSGSGNAGGSPAPQTAVTGFTPMPFTFVFDGGFFDLYHLFQTLNGYTQRATSGNLQVSGRLLTIQSVKLAPVQSAETKPGKTPSGNLTGTITATAYVLPATQDLTGGATPSSPGASGGSTTSASSSASASSPTAPAVVKVGP